MRRTRNSVKASEDPLQLSFWNAYPLVLYAHGYVCGIDLLGFHRHMHIVPGVFHCVIDEVEYGCSHFIHIALNFNSGPGMVFERSRLKIMERAGTFRTFF